MSRRILACTVVVTVFTSEWGYSQDWGVRAQNVVRARLSARPRAARSRSGDDAESDGLSPDDVRHIISMDTGRETASSSGFRLAAATESGPSPGDEPVESTADVKSAPEVDRGPLPGLGETIRRDVHDMWGDLWHDTKAVYLNPWNVVFLVGAGGTSLALRPEVDDDFEDHYRFHHTFSQGFRDGLDAFGSPATGFIVAGTWYLAGQVMQQDKTYEVGKRLASALIITDLSTLLLKVSAYTHGPNGERLAWPSGHMSSTMALATVLNDAYGPVVGVPMYGLTALLGIERLDSREHHFSDVIFGTALGWLVAEQVMKEHRPEIFGGEIVPYIDPENGYSGVAWLKTLGN